MVESSPWVPCKDCHSKLCPKFSEILPNLCLSIKEMTSCSWKCKSCEGEKDNIKTLLETMNLKLARDEEDREKILTSLKSIESVTKRVEVLEEKQSTQENKLIHHEEIIREQSQKIKELEGKSSHSVDMNQLVNKATTEMAEREKRSRNFLVHQLPESLYTDPDDILNDDRNKVEKLVSNISPKVHVVRLFRLGQP